MTLEDLTMYTVEFFFKTDDPFSTDTEVILGMSPVKIRKKPTSGEIQLFYGTAATFTVSYCDSGTAILADYWHHFAFIIDEETGTLACYLDGVELPVGANNVAIVATDIELPTELYYGYTSVPNNEQSFKGYLKELRWWRTRRTELEIKHFPETRFDAGTDDLIVYYHLDEGFGVFEHKDYGKDELTTALDLSWSLESRIDFNPFDINFCEPTYYSYYLFTSLAY